MENYINLLGFNIYSHTKKECLEEILTFKKIHIISGNPEILLTAYNTPSIKKHIEKDPTIIIPDGIGTKLAAKITNQHITEKIAGIDLMHDILDSYNKTGDSIYLLGSSEEVINSCVSKIQNQYKNITISGYHNGYFSKEDITSIVHTINNSKTSALFIAMGCPKQEQFALENMDKLNCKIIMGVGGAFDIISDKKQRAPKLMIKLGLEWLYRVIKEPFRLRRLIAIPQFLSLVFKNSL